MKSKRKIFFNRCGVRVWYLHFCTLKYYPDATLHLVALLDEIPGGETRFLLATVSSIVGSFVPVPELAKKYYIVNNNTEL